MTSDVHFLLKLKDQFRVIEKQNGVELCGSYTCPVRKIRGGPEFYKMMHCFTVVAHEVACFNSHFWISKWKILLFVLTL